MKVSTEIENAARSLGFTVTKTKGGHVKYCGHGQIIFGSSSPSDHLVLRKVINQLRKASKGGDAAKIIKTKHRKRKCKKVAGESHV